MDSDTWRIEVPKRENHLEAVSNLWGSVKKRCSHNLSDGFCDWETSRIGLQNGQVVTFWGVFDLRLRIGKALVRTAGVNWVVTRASHRRQGWMVKTGQASLAAMRQAGYDLTVLNGIEGYYERFGYIFAWPKTNFYVKTENLPSSELELETFTPGHREDLAEIYNRQHTGITGTAVRPTFHGFKWPDEFCGYAWRDAAGKTVGYLIGSKGASSYPFDCVDAAGEPELVLQALGKLARQWRYHEIQFDRLPYRSPLARQLRQLPCTFEALYPKSGGYLVQIVNLPSLMMKLCSVFEERLRGSYLSDWQGNLSIVTPDETVMLAIDRSKVRVLPSGETGHVLRCGKALAQLVVGTENPEEIAAASGMELSGDAGVLIVVLFPEQHPQLSVVDL